MTRSWLDPSMPGRFFARGDSVWFGDEAEHDRLNGLQEFTEPEEWPSYVLIGCDFNGAEEAARTATWLNLGRDLAGAGWQLGQRVTAQGMPGEVGELLLVYDEEGLRLDGLFIAWDEQFEGRPAEIYSGDEIGRLVVPA